MQGAFYTWTRFWTWNRRQLWTSQRAACYQAYRANCPRSLDSYLDRWDFDVDCPLSNKKERSKFFNLTSFFFRGQWTINVEIPSVQIAVQGPWTIKLTWSACFVHKIFICFFWFFRLKSGRHAILISFIIRMTAEPSGQALEGSIEGSHSALIFGASSECI